MRHAVPLHLYPPQLVQAPSLQVPKAGGPPLHVSTAQAVDSVGESVQKAAPQVVLGVAHVQAGATAPLQTPPHMGWFPTHSFAGSWLAGMLEQVPVDAPRLQAWQVAAQEVLQQAKSAQLPDVHWVVAPQVSAKLPR